MMSDVTADEDDNRGGGGDEGGGGDRWRRRVRGRLLRTRYARKVEQRATTAGSAATQRRI